MPIELLGVVIGVTALLFTSWGAIWYKLGKLTKECGNVKDEVKEIHKQIEHIIISRCDD